MFDMMTGLTANDKDNDDDDDKIVQYALFLYCVVKLLTKIYVEHTYVVLKRLQHYLYTYMLLSSTIINNTHDLNHGQSHYSCTSIIGR